MQKEHVETNQCKMLSSRADIRTTYSIDCAACIIEVPRPESAVDVDADQRSLLRKVNPPGRKDDARSQWS